MTPYCLEAPFLSKLWGYFSEFLWESCLAHLGILYLPTCVDFEFRYPLLKDIWAFSWEYGMVYFDAVAPGTQTLTYGIFSTLIHSSETKKGTWVQTQINIIIIELEPESK